MAAAAVVNKDAIRYGIGSKAGVAAVVIDALTHDDDLRVRLKARHRWSNGQNLE